MRQTKNIIRAWFAVGAFVISLILAPAALAADLYPQLDISGYKKYEYRQVNVSPLSNYYLGISHVGYSPTYSGGPWQESLVLAISGKLSERLSVGYDLEQQPDSYDKYNVNVKFDNHRLTFGDINANFSGNEFASSSKYVNGVMLTSNDNWYDLVLVPSAKGRSQTQALTTQNGTGIRGPYNLGHGSIVEGTERVELNGILLRRGVDYTIDYFEGKITFADILDSDDSFTYSYEYTNILDLFFSSLSRRSFFGFQNRVTLDPREIGRPEPKASAIINEAHQAFPTVFLQSSLEAQSENARNRPASVEAVTIQPFQPEVPLNEDSSNYYVVQAGEDFSSIILKSKNPSYDYLWGKVRYRAEDAMLFYQIIADTLGVKNPDQIYADQRLRVEQVTNPEIDRAKDYEFNLRDLKAKAAVSSGLVLVIGTSEMIAEEPTEEGDTIYIEGLGFIEPVLSPEEAARQQIVEDEEAGLFQLENYPLIRNSETVILGGKTLTRDVDYTIDYLSGKLSLQSPVLPSTENTLEVSYSHKLISAESEFLSGDGGRGPYQLLHNKIIPGSERVEVDGVLATNDYDYTIDYATGFIIFQFEISSASQISANYRYLVMREPEQLEGKGVSHKLVMGATYLREQADQGSETATGSVIQSITGSTVIANDNTIYLSYFPIASSTEATFTLSLNGVDLTPEVDYKIPTSSIDPATGYATVEPSCRLAYLNDRNDFSDGYTTGTVKLLRTIESTDEISVVYAYKKNVVARYSGTGTGSRGPYYMRNYHNVVPGSETVQVWQSGSSTLTTYTRNGSFDADAGVTGYAINYYDGNPYILFNEVLDTDYNFNVIFKYIADNSTSNPNLIKDVIGIDGAIKFGDWLDVKAAVARSSVDRVIAKAATTESFTGDDSRTYTLHADGDIIDNSEVVKVNGYVLNRDVEYYINYSAPGQMVFYYITPSSADALVIDYEYETSDSSSVSEVAQTIGTAYNIEGTSKLGDFSLFGAIKQIDNSFTPIGGTSIGVGSNRKDYKIAYTPTKKFSVYTSLRETASELSNYADRFSYGWDRNSAIAYASENLGTAGLTYRNYLTTNDRLPGSSIRDNDTLLESWDTSYDLPKLTFGDLTFTNENDFKASSTRYDFLDQQTPTSKITNYFRTNNVLKFSDRFSFTYDHQISEPITTRSTDETGSTTEVVSAHTLSRDTTYDLMFNLTQWGLKKWTTRVKLVNHDGLDILNPTAEAANTRNESYQIEFIPINILSSSLDHTRSETLTYVASQANPKSEKTSAVVSLAPHSSTTLKWNAAWDDAVAASGSFSQGNSNTYTLDYVPIVWGWLRFAMKFTKYDRDAMAPSGSAEVTTITDSFSQDYTFTYVPFAALKIIPGFKQENYTNYNDSSSSPVDTRTENQTTKISLAYTPLPRLDFTSSYDLKVTRSLADDISRHKSVLKAGVTYRIFSSGTLSYDWTKENNQGEVQAGSLTNLNFVKLTDAIALSVTFPQNNPILSSVVLKTAYKHVNYANYLSESDSFDASLLTFEGTLNF